MFQNVPPCSSNKDNTFSLHSENTMKLKIISLTLLMILLLAPLGQLVYAQDTGDTGTSDGTGDDGSGGTGDTNSTIPDTNSTLPDTNTTLPDTGDDENSTDTGDGNIDPLVFEQIQTMAQLRYQEMYQLMFGGNGPEPDSGDENATDTDPVPPDGNTTDPKVTDDNSTYTGLAFPDDVDPAIANAFMHAWQAMEQGADEDANPQAAANAYMRALKQLRNAYRKYEQDNPTVADDLNPTDDTLPEDEIPDAPTDDEVTEIQQQLVERFQERLTSMYENYNNVSSELSADDAVKALNALAKAEQKLLRIQARIDAGNTTGALDDLDNATETMDEDFDSLDDAAARQMLKTMNKLEERIQKMEEKAARKAATGEDTSEEDALLASLKGNKNKTTDDFKTNNGNSGNNGNLSDKETGKPDKEDKETDKPDKEDKVTGQDKKDK